MEYTGEQVIGGLLRGGSLLFGKRVELSWPDGLPKGMTEDGLRVIGAEMAPFGRPEWVRADAEFCGVTGRCGAPLVDGECYRHGRPETPEGPPA